MKTILGEEYGYSGFVAPEILAIILEKIYQKPYEKLLESFILKKVQMNNTSIKIGTDNTKNILKGDKLVIKKKATLLISDFVKILIIG